MNMFPYVFICINMYEYLLHHLWDRQLEVAKVGGFRKAGPGLLAKIARQRILKDSGGRGHDAWMRKQRGCGRSKELHKTSSAIQ